MLFPIKLEAESLQEMMSDVVESTGFTDMTPGSITKSLLEVFNRKLNACYKYFDQYISMSFLSTAEGIYLDMIGKMLGCSRLSLDETDVNYRYRISQQVFTAAAANRTSLRLKCLAVSKVKDVIMTPYTRGNGSFTIHVITDEIDTPREVLSAVESAVALTKAEGVKAIVTKPKIVPVDITFKVILRNGNAISDASLSSQIKTAVSDYMDAVSMGGSFSIYEMMRIAQANNSVGQAYVTALTVDDESVIIKPEYRLEWDERAYVNSVNVLIGG